jgi:hypothetical protein
MKNKQIDRKTMLFFLALEFAVGCAASPESASPGTCTLNCSKTRVGAVEYGVRRLFPDKRITLPCSLQGAQNGISPHNGPVQVRYLIYENVPPFTTLPEPAAAAGGGAAGGGAAGGGAAGGGTAATGARMLQTGPLEAIVPKPGIGFEPVLFGSVSVEKTNAEFKSSPTEATPFKFAGVVTPSSEWCSDSCGVATFEFWPNCITGGQTIQSGIFIQNTPVEESYEIELTPY